MHPYHQPVDLPFRLPTRIYGGMLVIWLLKPNLQQRFPLHKKRREDYQSFLAWCAAIGRRECVMLTEIEAWNEELRQPINLPEIKGDPWQEVYSCGMYLAGLHRAKYWQGQISASKTQRHRTARWFFREGRQLIGLDDIPQWQHNALVAGFNTPEQLLEAITLPRDQKTERAMVMNNNIDLISNWHETALRELVTPQTVDAGNWVSRMLARGLPVKVNELLALTRGRHGKPTTEEQTRIARLLDVKNKAPAVRRSVSFESRPFGVNLYGYAKGELGIGEDVRMLALALQAVGIPFCIINIELGNDVSQADASADSWIAAEPLYATNIFCMTGIELTRYVAERGAGVLAGHYNIGLWPWELPEWPEAWHHAWSLVDELWGISQYTADAYAKAPVPVTPIPLPVVIGEVGDYQRERWQLPESAYLFVFSFDMNSTPTRKNPAGVIESFKKAFAGKSANEVGLVLKISHLKREKPQWKQLEKLIKGDSRIHLINSELRRPEVLALYRNCDCYVSLHRSEGFGRGLAEAQLLGMRLIATGYSGNMEFCRTPPTLQVKYRLKPLATGDYFYGDGQQWADPNIDHAAQLMQQCLRQGRRYQALEYDTVQFTPAHCGRVFKQRLEQIVQLNTEQERTAHER